MRFSVRVAWRTVLLLAAPSFRVAAQVPHGADTLSAKSVAESLAVLSSIEATLHAGKKDVAALYHQGMVAWALSDRAAAKPGIAGLDRVRLEHIADTSLRTAAESEPSNARYPLAYGLFLRYANNSGARLAGFGYLTRAVNAARAAQDPAILGMTALEAGRAHWLEYDSQADRRNYVCRPPIGCDIKSGSDCVGGLPTVTGGSIDSPGDVVSANQEMHNRLIRCTSPIEESGEAEYLQAEALFREAARAAPNDARIFRHMAMLLAEKGRWHELQIVAHDHVTRLPDDAWGWLVLGLALHRGGLSAQATAAFDTGTMRLSSGERARLLAFNRLLAGRDSAAYMRAAPAAKDGTERTFWAMADPLWSRKGNNPRTEFLARVTFAEVRWTVEELGVRGADSDRGEMHIRWGPPQMVVMLRGSDFDTVMDTIAPTIANLSWRAAGELQHSDVATYWDYDFGAVLVFWGPPTYGTARVTGGDALEALIEMRPSSFDNVVTGRVDVMPLRTTRFRAPGDSVDLLFAAQAPVAAIRAATAANNPVREDTWLFGRDVPNAYRDTVMLDASGIKSWTYRVPPASYMYRVEASAEGALLAGRAMTWITAARDTITGFTTRGFGISDVLLATRADPRGTPARWRDFEMAPLAGTVAKRSNVELIWENYELGQRGREAQYQVTLTIQRRRSAAGHIMAQIVGAIASAVKVDRRDDRIVQQFDRDVAYAPAIVDHLTVALGDTPAGTYRVTLEITDRVTGRKTSRFTELAIGQ